MILYHPDTLRPMSKAENIGRFGVSVDKVLEPLTRPPPAVLAAGQQIQLFASRSSSTIMAVNPVGAEQIRGNQVKSETPLAEGIRGDGAAVGDMGEMQIGSGGIRVEASSVDGQGGVRKRDGGMDNESTAGVECDAYDQQSPSLVPGIHEPADAAGAEHGFIPLEGATSSKPLPSTRLRPQDRPTKSLSEDLDPLSTSQPRVLMHHHLLTCAQFSAEERNALPQPSSHMGWLSRFSGSILNRAAGSSEQDDMKPDTVNAERLCQHLRIQALCPECKTAAKS